MQTFQRFSLLPWFLLGKAAVICGLAASFIGSAETAQAHDDHGTNVVLDISRTNNNRVVLQFDTQANKSCSIQHLTSFVSTNLNGTNVVLGGWATLITIPPFNMPLRQSVTFPATNLNRIYRLKIF
jgi:hypothetical protein